jgi:rubrerythrin
VGGGAIFCGVLAPVMRRDFRRELAARGFCTHCGYALTDNVSGVCPECGTKAAVE